MDDRIRETINQLVALALVGDSHENLSAICLALMGSGRLAYGWTISACSSLRDVLVGMLEQLDPDEWSNEYLAEVGLMRLPKDADGEYIHVGDRVDFTENVRGLTVIGVGTSSTDDSDMGVFVRDDDGYTWFNARFLHHYHAPTIEDMLREFAAEVQRCCDTEDTIAEYAAKLREVMADE